MSGALLEQAIVLQTLNEKGLLKTEGGHGVLFSLALPGHSPW